MQQSRLEEVLQQGDVFQIRESSDPDYNKLFLAKGEYLGHLVVAQLEGDKLDNMYVLQADVPRHRKKIFSLNRQPDAEAIECLQTNVHYIKEASGLQLQISYAGAQEGLYITEDFQTGTFTRARYMINDRGVLVQVSNFDLVKLGLIPESEVTRDEITKRVSVCSSKFASKKLSRDDVQRVHEKLKAKTMFSNATSCIDFPYILAERQDFSVMRSLSAMLWTETDDYLHYATLKDAQDDVRNVRRSLDDRQK